MKPLVLQFVPDRRWRAVWAAAIALVVGLVAVAGQSAVMRFTDLARLSNELAVTAMNKEVARVNAPRQIEAINPVHAHLVKLLQQDLNPAFSVAENMGGAGTTLLSMQYEASTGAVRLEFELDSMSRVPSITQALNAGFDKSPWVLEQVVAPDAARPSVSPITSSMGSQIGAAIALPTSRGTWTATLSKL